MKKKYIAIIAGIVVVACATVLAVVNPFGLGGNSNNSTQPNGDSSNYTEPPEDTWISPGIFYLDDEDHIKERKDAQGQITTYTVHGVGPYVLGEPRILKLRIYNGGNQTATFSVDYRHPDNVDEGYARLPSDIRQWIKISDTRPVIDPGEIVEVTIKLSVPSNADIPGDKFEFWLGVIDQSQTGMIITELAQRWLVTVSENITS